MKRLILLVLAMIGLVSVFSAAFNSIARPALAQGSSATIPVATVYSGVPSNPSSTVLAGVTNQTIYIQGFNFSTSGTDTIALYDNTTLIFSFGSTTSPYEVSTQFWKLFGGGNGYPITSGHSLKIACSGGSIVHSTFALAQY